MLPKKFDFTPAYRGDTLHLPGFAFIDADTNLGVDLTGCVIRMQFRKDNEIGKIAIYRTTNDGTILVPYPSVGVFYTPGFLLDIPAGNYLYDIEITHEDGTVTTYLEGALYVRPDKTI